MNRERVPERPVGWRRTSSLPLGQWQAWRKVLAGEPLDREDSIWIGKTTGSVQEMLDQVRE